MFVGFISTVVLLSSGCVKVDVSAEPVKNKNSDADSDVLSLSVNEHDWPLADSRGRRTSALCQSHQQRPAGIRHVTCTQHWCLYRLLLLARFLRKKKSISSVESKVSCGCRSDNTQRFLNLPKVLKLRVQVEVAHSTLRTVSMLVTCLPLDASPERVLSVMWSWYKPKRSRKVTWVWILQRKLEGIEG